MFGFLVNGLTAGLLSVHFIAIIAIAALIAWLVRSWQLAIGTAVSLLLIVGMNLWVPAMQTMSLVLVATVVAVLIAVPLGIWSARNAAVRTLIKPVLDFMQTMPAFVYLIPAIVFFADLARTARRGWAVDDAEFEDFVGCVAVPIVTSAGVVGALSLTALRVAQTRSQLEQRVPMLRETAAEIARQLG